MMSIRVAPERDEIAETPGVRFDAGPSRYYRDTSYAGASRIRKQLANWQPMRAPADADLLPDQDLLVARFARPRPQQWRGCWRVPNAAR